MQTLCRVRRRLPLQDAELSYIIGARIPAEPYHVRSVTVESIADAVTPFSSCGRGYGAVDHWRWWRPDWHIDRPCLYWYLAVDSGPLRTAAQGAAKHLGAVPWLDIVPPQWRHLTICDIGFEDELTPHQISEVARAVDCEIAGGKGRGDLSAQPLQIVLGPVVALASALVLRAEPVDPLRLLHAVVRDATQRVLGPGLPLIHTQDLWPHVTLGYANRDSAQQFVDEVMASAPRVSVTVPVDRLTLASVTRRGRHYQWVVQRHVDLTKRRSS